MADTPLPVLDPAEPITPELVLVSPELRKRALAHARPFPEVVQDAARFRTEEPAAPAARPPRSRIFMLAAAAVIVAIGATVALLATRRVGPSLERLTRDGGGVATQHTAGAATPAPNTTSIEPIRTTRRRRPPTRVVDRASQPKPTTTAPRQAQPAGVATETARPATRRLARRAERDVLNSPQFFLRLGIAGRRFVDPATRLFRAQVSIRCSQPLGATHLSCIVRRGNASLVVLYFRRSAHAFRLARP